MNNPPRNLIPKLNRVYNTRLSYNISPMKIRHDYFKNSFFSSAMSEWNKLDFNTRNSASLSTFEKKLLNFIRPCENSIFHIHNPLGIKFLKRLHLGLMNINLDIAFQILSILHAKVAKILNQKCISVPTAPTFSFLDKHSFGKLRTLMITFYLKAKRN